LESRSAIVGTRELLKTRPPGTLGVREHATGLEDANTDVRREELLKTRVPTTSGAGEAINVLEDASLGERRGDCRSVLIKTGGSPIMDSTEMPDKAAGEGIMYSTSSDGNRGDRSLSSGSY
jgi:hypothetical protein